MKHVTLIWTWLNYNAAAVEVLATIGSLVSVITMGFWSSRYARKTIDEMQAQRSLSVRPWLEVWENAPQTLTTSLDITDPDFPNLPPAFFHLVNIGAGKAFHILLKVPTNPGFIVQNQDVVIVPDQAVMVRYPAPRGALSIVVTYQDLDEVTHGLTIHFDQNHKWTVNRAKPRKD